MRWRRFRARGGGGGGEGGGAERGGGGGGEGFGGGGYGGGGGGAGVEEAERVAKGGIRGGANCTRGERNHQILVCIIYCYTTKVSLCGDRLL